MKNLSPELVGCVRSLSSHPKIKILVGGYPFNLARDLWRQVGADGHAPDAQEAVWAATRLLEKI